VADDLDTFLSALQTKWAAVTGIEAAPTHPPEQVNEPGTVVSYIVRGRPSNYHAGTWVHEGRSDVYIGRSDLYHDETYARPFILRGLDMFAGNVAMSSSCEGVLVMGYDYGALQGTDWIVIRFEWEAKIQHTALNLSA